MSELPELVDLSMIFPSLYIGLKYAIADSIADVLIYRGACCLLHIETVTVLAKSISIAQLAGLQLVVYNAYRSRQAQAVLRNACPDPQYIASVAIGPNHSWGTAIDVTLMDDRDYLLNMSAGSDEMHDRSYAWHPSVPPAAQRNRLLLNAIILGGGSVDIDSEWWHFESSDAVRYPLPDD